MTLPTYFLASPLRPLVAVFESIGVAFAIGAAVFERWRGTSPDVRILTPAEFDHIISSSVRVVADIADNQPKNRGFAPTNKPDRPGCVLICWRDEMYRRHNIDSPSWWSALGIKEVTPVDGDALAKDHPYEGVGLHSAVVLPREEPEWCVTFQQVWVDGSGNSRVNDIGPSRTVRASSGNVAKAKLMHLVGRAEYLNSNTLTARPGPCR